MPPRNFRRIPAEQALALIFSACDQERAYSLFDVRDAHSYGHGHIPTAQLMAERDIGRWLAELPRGQLVLFYCFHGFSSQTFAKAFADFGFCEVYSIDGGFGALTEALARARAAAEQGSTRGPRAPRHADDTTVRQDDALPGPSPAP